MLDVDRNVSHRFHTGFTLEHNMDHNAATAASAVKHVACALLGLLLTTPLGAGEGWVYPTLPGTDIRDVQAEPWRVQGQVAYPVYPGTDIRRYGAPERLIPYAGRWYRARPGSSAPDVRHGDFRGPAPRPARH
jgi:hypothetical protein